MEILQLQYIDKVIDVFCAGPAGSCAVVGDSRDPTVAARRFLDQIVACPLFATTGAVVVDVLAQFIDVMDVPVIMQRRLYSGSASDSVRRQSPWTVQLCNREWYSTFCSGAYGGDDGMAVWIGGGGAFSAVLTPFFALLRLSRS